MKVDGAIRSPIQGVSQQPARSRLPGQCTLQENFSSNPVTGLTRRPPLEHVKLLSTFIPPPTFEIYDATAQNLGSAITGYTPFAGFTVECIIKASNMAAGGNGVVWALTDTSKFAGAFLQFVTNANPRIRFFIEHYDGSISTNEFQLDLFGTSFANATDALHHIALSVSPSGKVIASCDGVICGKLDGIAYPILADGGLSIRQYGASGNTWNAGTVEYLSYRPFPLNEAQMRKLTRTTLILPGITYHEDFDLFCIIGQSGAVGTIPIGSETPVYNAGTGTVKMINNEMEWVDYSDPFDDNTNSVVDALDDATPGIGSAGFFAYQLAASTGGKIAVVPVCKATTSMYENWGDGVHVSTVAPQQADLTHAGALLLGGMQQIICAGQHAPYKAWIHKQGEKDATDAVGDPTRVTKYAERGVRMYRAWRNGVGADIPIIINSLHRWAPNTNAEEADWLGINDQLFKMHQQLPNSVFIDNTDLNPMQGDEIHTDYVGYQTMAQRWHDVIYNQLYLGQ